MRILFANLAGTAVGGAEIYIERIARLLVSRGHEVGLLCELATQPGERELDIGPGPRISIAALGLTPALQIARGWAPDVTYVNGTSVGLERALLKMGPSAISAHSYAGTCISGLKRTSLPHMAPCQREFGPACLAHYFPRRCGGRSPASMWTGYKEQEARLALLREHDALVVHSRHMQIEYARHRLDSTIIPYPIEGPGAQRRGEDPQPRSGAPERLLFVGRVEAQKGISELVEALPLVARSLAREIQLDVVGDGRSRPLVEAQAAVRVDREPRVRVTFHGHRGGDELASAYRDADLLVVPSLWGEPFGMVGLEAALFGTPAVAFPLGGICEWLVDGESGSLATDLTVEGLARAIVGILADHDRWARFRLAARRAAVRYQQLDPVPILMGVLEEAIAKGHRRLSSVPS